MKASVFSLQRVFFLSTCLVCLVFAPPPQRPAAEQQKAAEQQQQQQHGQQEAPRKPLYEFAYSKYLEEVVKVLESDPKFQERLKGMPEEDIKSGKIAEHLHEIGPSAMEELTRAKLSEIERLREMISKQIQVDGGAHNIHVPDHIDVTNWENFGKDDLKKLIVRTVADMDEIDKQRKAEFKEYELKKKAEEDHRLAQMSPDDRAKQHRDLELAQQRHNEHEKVKHPGSRDQLEEVWEDRDEMPKDAFDPKTFFNLHDLNGDGYWNAEELEALFQMELDKVYNESNPDDDPRERIEEMYRMREHVVKQMDKNNDRMISLQEFLQDSEAQTPNRDEGWQDLNDKPQYTDEELRKFEAAYARDQGWGEHAYSTPVPTAVPAPYGNQQQQVHDQQPVGQQQQHVQQGQQQYQQQPPQQVHQQQQQQPVQAQQVQHQQQFQQQPPQQPQQVQPVQQQPPVPVAQQQPVGIDKNYGI